MSIYVKIQQSLTGARKQRNPDAVNIFSLIKGELDRVMTIQDDGTKGVTDKDALKVISKMRKQAEESAANGAELDVEYVNILKAYLPREMDVDAIRGWINKNISFNDYNSKMQAMRPIMAALGPRGADGNTVKQILMEM